MLEQMAKSAGATRAQITQLRRELALASKQGASTLNQLTKQSAMARKLNLAGAGTRFTAGRGALGRGATGALGAAGMVGSMAGGTGPVSGFLGGAAMIASFLPGPLGLISGAVLGIGSAIAGGFEAAAEAEKQKKEEERQKKIEIEAERVDLQAENVTELKGTTQTLIGAGALATDVQGIIDRGVQGLRDQGIEGISDYEAAFQSIVANGFADVFAGNKQGLKDGILTAIGTVSKTGLYNPEEAAALLDPIFDAAGGGQAGLNAVNAYIKRKKFDQVQIYTPTTGTGAEILPKGEAISRRRTDFIMGNAQSFYGPQVDALKGALADIDSDILGMKGTIDSEEVLKALGLTRIEFNNKYIDDSGLGFNTTELKSALTSKLAEVQRGLTTGSTSAVPYGPGIDASGNSMINNGTLPKPLGTVPIGPGIAANGVSMINTGTLPGMSRIVGTSWMNSGIPTAGWRPPMAAQNDPTANAVSATANSAALLANTAGSMANSISTWTNKPTYIIINTDKPVTNTTAGDLLNNFVKTGVTPTPNIRRTGG